MFEKENYMAKTKIIVIGANHAGTAAINTLTSTYPNTEVTVYDRNNNISFLGCGMALWIGGQIKGGDGLFYNSPEKMIANGAKVHMEAEVLHVDPQAKTVQVRLKDGRIIVDNYDKLILATGSLPIDPPNIEGLDLENVQHVKIYQDAKLAIDTLKNKKIETVAVVGAGYVGVELAEAFRRCGKKVKLIDMADRSLSTYYDRPFTDLMDKNLADHGIELCFNEKIIKFAGENGVLTKVVTDKNEHACDMAVLAIGFKPNTALMRDQLDTFKNGAYIVNEHQQTSNPDIYAVGDCAVIYDNAQEDWSYIALATNAVRSGIVAAHNAAGTKLNAIGVQGSNGINIYDLKMVSTGLTLERATKLGIEALATYFEDYQRPEFMEVNNPKVKIRIVYRKDDRRVIGCQMASNYDMSMGIHFFSLAIQEKVTIDRLALTDIFFLPHFNKPYNYITMAAYTAK